MPEQPHASSDKSQRSVQPSESVLHHTVRETGSAVVGSLVGLALGGAPGALVGAAAGPLLSTTLKVAGNALQRRRERAERVFNDALAAKGISPEQAVNLLDADDEKADVFLNLLAQAAAADPGVESVFSSLLGEMLASSSAVQRDRLLIIADALKGMRSVHMRILSSLQSHGGVRSARDLSDDVGIPEVELRSVVRDLEMRGMIKDRGLHPVEWSLRALGRGIVEFSAKRQTIRLP